jgi:hypothetical protein
MPFFSQPAEVFLELTRDTVVVRTSSAPSHIYKAVLTLEAVDETASTILAVDLDEDVMRRNVAEAFSSGKLPCLPDIVVPNQITDWTPYWQWPPSLTVTGIPNSYLVIWPLRQQSWSPPLVTQLVRYCLVHSGIKAPKFFRRRTLNLNLASDFSLLEMGELLDAVAAVPERFRPRLASGLTLPPRPRTSIDRRYARVRFAAALIKVLAVGSVVAFRSNLVAFFALLTFFLATALFLDRAEQRLVRLVERQAPRRDSVQTLQ